MTEVQHQCSLPASMKERTAIRYNLEQISLTIALSSRASIWLCEIGLPIFYMKQNVEEIVTV